MSTMIDKLADAVAAFMAVGLPTLAVFGWLAFRSWTRHQRDRMQLELELVRERAAIGDAQDERLAQRVAVLERILTDRSATLGDEIERLRAKPLN